MSGPSPVAKMPTLSLEALDTLPDGDLVLFCAEDERPLQAAAGFVDWRLNGWLSRQVLSGKFAGKSGERLLTPGGGLLQSQRIFVFGIGPTDQFHVQMAENLGKEVGAALKAASSHKLIIGQPGTGEPDAWRALFQALRKTLDSVKMTTWGSWSNI